MMRDNMADLRYQVGTLQKQVHERFVSVPTMESTEERESAVLDRDRDRDRDMILRLD